MGRTVRGKVWQKRDGEIIEGGRGNEDETKEERECGEESEEKKEDFNDQGRVDNKKGWRKKEKKDNDLVL